MQMNYAPGIFSKPYERKTNAFSAAGFANPAILILKSAVIHSHPSITATAAAAHCIHREYNLRLCPLPSVSFDNTT
jgi:hypothetical protein